MTDFLPYGRQEITEADIRNVARVLRGPYVTQGPEIERFEEKFARFVGAPYAVAVANGTAGLHLACLAAGFGREDEVITTPMSFAASANCILYAGARPRFVDIEDEALGLDSAKVRKAVTKKTKGIVNVHFAGHPSRLGPARKYSSRKDFFVIEDACHALGAEVKKGGRWEKIGAASEADMCIFSFHPVKHITTGEGGMVTTRRKDLYEKLKLLRTHGIEKNAALFVKKGNAGKPWYYEMQALGFNYRITDFQCALGASQLARLGAMVAQRRRIASFYNKALSGVRGLHLPVEAKDCRSSYHLYPVRIDFRRIGKSREQVMRELRAQRIGTQVHYIPIVDQPFYSKNFKTSSDAFPVSRRYYEEALSIPMFSSMSLADAARAARAVKKVLGAHVA